MNHLQKIWLRLEEGEPAVLRPAVAASQPHSRRHAVLSTFALLQNDEKQRRQWIVLNPPKLLPHHSGAPYYIVHLYSGRRREGDFHSYMQELIDDGPFATNSISLLSIDTAMSERLNVHSPELWQFLETIARAGQVLAFLLGPMRNME